MVEVIALTKDTGYDAEGKDGKLDEHLLEEWLPMPEMGLKEGLESIKLGDLKRRQMTHKNDRRKSE